MIEWLSSRFARSHSVAFSILSVLSFWAVPTAIVVMLASCLFYIEDVVTLIWLGSVVNGVISTLKAALAKAMPQGGKALMADAVHGLGDCIAAVVSAVAYVEASRPPDWEHPWGHGKIESVGALVVASILLYVACMLACESASSVLQLWQAKCTQQTSEASGFRDERAGSPAGALLIDKEGTSSMSQTASCRSRSYLREAGLAVTLASLILKEALFRATLHAGYIGASRLAVATAWHHRSDSLAAGTALVSQVGASFGQHYLDPVGGGIVAAMLAHSAGENLLESLKDLLDYNVASDEGASAWRHCSREALAESIVMVPGVLNHTLRTRRMGPFCVVDATIVVEARISASSASVVAEAVHNRVIKDFQPYVTDVTVHVDPKGSPQSHRLDTRTEQVPPVGVPALPEPADVEERVRAAVLSVGSSHPELPEIIGISEVQIYFYSEVGDSSESKAEECTDGGETCGETDLMHTLPKVAVKVDLRLPHETLLHDARMLAGVARRSVLAALPDLVREVDIDLELDEVEIPTLTDERNRSLNGDQLHMEWFQDTAQLPNASNAAFGHSRH